jgi:F-type H+-transporting ATPase subunit delta
MIHAASRQAFAQLQERLNDVLEALPSSDGGESHKTLAAELYATADLLAGQPRLRRALGDASTDGSTRAELIGSLLAGKVGDAALGLVKSAVELRWSSSWDLTDALEIIADEALLSAAEQQGKLDEVEDQLFRFERILADSGELVAALDEAGVPAERRRSLLDAVVSGKVDEITAELLRHGVSSGRKRSLILAIDELLEASARRRARSIARVISATELSADQTSRLGASLSRLYGREINVRTAVDPSIKGGLIVRVGDEVIDGTVASRLAAARAALAG